MSDESRPKSRSDGPVGCRTACDALMSVDHRVARFVKPEADGVRGAGRGCPKGRSSFARGPRRGTSWGDAPSPPHREPDGSRRSASGFTKGGSHAIPRRFALASAPNDLTKLVRAGTLFSSERDRIVLARFQSPHPRRLSPNEFGERGVRMQGTIGLVPGHSFPWSCVPGRRSRTGQCCRPDRSARPACYAYRAQNPLRPPYRASHPRIRRPSMRQSAGRLPFDRLPGTT